MPGRQPDSGVDCRRRRPAGTTYRVYEGLPFYLNNPEGVAFDVHLEVRDLNLFSHGPRELMVKA